MMLFKELNLSKPILSAIEEIGFEQATPIQEQAIPIALAGKDVIGQAQTGTGKTALLLYLFRKGDSRTCNPSIGSHSHWELCIQIA